MSRQQNSPQQGQASSPSAFWAVLGRVDVVIGVLLGVLLLPLIIGPFVLVYEFIKAGALGYAALVGTVFACCVVLAIRAVRRGEFGPGTLALVLGLLAIMFLVATRLGQ